MDVTQGCIKSHRGAALTRACAIIMKGVLFSIPVQLFLTMGQQGYCFCFLMRGTAAMLSLSTEPKLLSSCLGNLLWGWILVQIFPAMGRCNGYCIFGSMHGHNAWLHQKPKEGLLQQWACTIIIKGILISIRHGCSVHNAPQVLISDFLSAR